MARRMIGRVHRILAGFVVAIAVLSTATACGSDSASDDTIRFALDWTPNTNHTGLFVAQQRGFFAESGLDVEILPYNNTAVDTVVDAGNAQFGISTHNSSTFSRASGAHTISVLAPLQRWATGIGVRAGRDDIASPKDLDGRTYAGFGDPGEEETLKQVIRNDGGTGDFTSVTLGTSAYEAVYSGRADFTVSYLAWEGIEAEHHGTPMKYFDYTDFGFPEAYAIVVDANEDWLAENPERAAKFVRALQRGYQAAAEDPDAAARDLIEANPGAFNDEQLVIESQRMLADRYMKDADGKVGTQTLEQWAGNSGFLYRSGLLTGPDGAPLTAEPDWSTYFTNEYLG
ncbi:ABC-type nitrate/sulfonate/bicarbonate transport system, periplasmic component [Gordonia terrae C-6]|uniref:Thiamine pyrimidine synthase n=1 Tax=Gordonia terrae C-6 TaxID=1316928 RepID=R7YFV3_9ACTN|nr:ABC transporter substrate-binding protein [Gordonia terrae]EON34664.1 ABC-type nitrate/sulfonate/bicarbonate transport system, periplasmic component [Gordonia terrae C-6]